MVTQFQSLAQDMSSNQILHQGLCHQGLYPLQPSSSPPSGTTALLTTSSSAELWHRRLGHPHGALLQHLSHTYHLPIHSSFNTHACYACNKGKSHRLPFPLSVTNTSVPFELIHADVWGPAPIASFSGYRYYLLLIDDFTRYSWLFPLRFKSEVAATIKAFRVFVSNQFGLTIKTIRTDCGGEFLNKVMTSFFSQFGILQESTCPYTPQQNGLVERKHGHIVETAITLLQQANMPIQFWLEAITTALYLINRLPHSSLKFEVPYHKLYKLAPDYNCLKPFGCCCFPWLRPYSSNKLEPRSKPCIFLGYCSGVKGYRCFDPLSNKVYTSRHVKFLETDFPYLHLLAKPSPVVSVSSSSFPSFVVPSPTSIPFPIDFSPAHVSPLSSPTHTHAFPSPTPTTTPVAPVAVQSPFVPIISTSNAPSQPISSSVIPYPSLSNHHMVTRSKNGITAPKVPLSLVIQSSPIIEPHSFKEAMAFPEWRKAMTEEYTALMSQGTWTLVSTPPGVPVIGCKWVFRIKRNSDGSVARYKARLVAQGYQQTEGVDYSETFSPVIKQPTVRVVLSLALHFGWTIRQLDISNAFLHGHLQEQVYMRQPQGYVDSQFPLHVCHLKKALYGLKQAPRAWYDMLSHQLVSLGFKNSLADSSLFIFHHASDLVYVLVYVDDLLITGSNSQLITQFIAQLSGVFALKDLGNLHYFLGIEAIPTSKGVILSQTKYAVDLLAKAGMTDCRPCSTPSSMRPDLDSTSTPMLNPELYRSVVGSLQYLTLTRPEISFAVNSVCQHMHHPLESHYTAVKRILRYIKGTLDHGLAFTKGSLVLSAFTDADWAGDAQDRRSTGGYCVFLGPNLVSWSAKKQATVARSSTEAEYKALANVASEVVWLLQLFTDLHTSVFSVPPIIWCDNNSAISLATNPVFHARTKHIEVDFHFVREKIALKQLQVRHVPSALQVADIFTKPLTVARFLTLRDKLQLSLLPASVCGGMLSSETRA